MNYLVLLTTFCESPELVFTHHLAQQGHQVYVTTVSTGGQLQDEIAKAKQLSQQSSGNIELVQPAKGGWLRGTPTGQWIQSTHQQHFSNLPSLDVQIIVGVLPGTAQTAIDLKREKGCKTFLLATCKLRTRDQGLQKDIIELATEADGVWSLGPDNYIHYESVFHDAPKIKHNEIILLPNPDTSTPVEKLSRNPRSVAATIVSIWNKRIEFYINNIKKYSRGGDISGFYSLAEALGQINSSRRDQIRLYVHGLQTNDQKVYAMRKYAKQNLKLTPMSSVPSFDSYAWIDCLAFIVPDVQEETFNIHALKAIQYGIPTLVSSQSSIGKFLRSLPCPEVCKALVNLTGDHVHDVNAWVQKINSEIHGRDVNPFTWAAKIKDYLQEKSQYLRPELSQLVANSQSNNYAIEVNNSFAASPLHNLSALNDTYSNSKDMRQNLQTFTGNYAVSPRVQQFKRQSMSRPGSNVCPLHTDLTVSIFCERCRCTICGECKKSKSHNSHDVILLGEKTQEMTSQLKNLIQNCNREENQAERELTDIEKNREDALGSYEMEKQDMDQQYNFVTTQLSKLYAEETHRLDEAKAEELSRFDARAVTLKEHKSNHMNMKDKANALLTRLPEFAREAQSFLSSSHIDQLPAVTDIPIKQLFYRSPYLPKEPDEFRFIAEEQIIGYFASDDEELRRQERRTHQPLHSLKRCESIRSFGGDSAMTQMTRSVATRKTVASIMPTIKKGISPLELLSYTNTKIFEGSHLKVFSSVLFSGSSLWVCGWNTNWWGAKTTVLLNVSLDEYYNTSAKEKNVDSNADLPTIMVPQGDKIIFSMKGGSEVFSFNTKTRSFWKVYSTSKLKVAALCGGHFNLFLLNKKDLGSIKILDPSFEGVGKIPISLWEFKECTMDMCVLKSSSGYDPKASESHTLIISTSSPHGTVRAVNDKTGPLWVVNSSHPQLNTTFSPYSVSSCLNGAIYVADNMSGEILTISRDGESVQSVLNKAKGIKAPTLIEVDDEGQSVIIINRDGTEIRHCKINTVLNSILDDLQEVNEQLADMELEDDTRRASVNSSSSVQEDQEELTDAKILRLSTHFAKAAEVREIAITGLGMANAQVESEITDNRGQMNDVAYNLFHTWCKAQPNRIVALTKMCQALDKCNKSLLKKELEI